MTGTKCWLANGPMISGESGAGSGFDDESAASLITGGEARHVPGGVRKAPSKVVEVVSRQAAQVIVAEHVAPCYRRSFSTVSTRSDRSVPVASPERDHSQVRARAGVGSSTVKPPRTLSSSQ